MPAESLPFLTERIAKAKMRRQVVRTFGVAFVASIVSSFSIGANLTTPHNIRNAAIFLFIEGVPFGFILTFARFGVPKIHMPSIGLAILFRATAYALIFFSAIGLTYLAISAATGYFPHIGANFGVVGIIFASSYLWIIVVVGARGVSRKIGPGAFWHWVRGYYYSPKEEERIFMFLDMRRSTELAEKLGDMKFSKLVRDFFEDLTSPITETRAEVSHYIGDEAVLTWWPNQGLKDANCIQLFFRMQAIIDRRRIYYFEEYGEVPEFKAGAHIGRVVATEVGSIKSEIVFHGDVLNTTARVQGACSEFGSQFLITEALATRLPSVSWLDLQPIGGVALKGKSEKVQLFSASVKTK